VTQAIAPGRLRYVLTLLVAIPAGAAVFYAVCRQLKVDELDLAVTAFRRPFERLRARIR
jgi:hypothetical protein